jgi:hypothetical protein
LFDKDIQTTQMKYPFFDEFEKGFVYRASKSLYSDYYDYPCEEEDEEDEDEEEAPEDYDDDVIEGGYYPINSFNLVGFLMRLR